MPLKDLALTANALRYAFYAVAGCLDKAYCDAFEKNPNSIAVHGEALQLVAETVTGIDPNNHKDWPEETRQVKARLGKDDEFAARFVAHCDSYVGLFNGVVAAEAETPTDLARIALREMMKDGLEQGMDLSGDFEELGAHNLSRVYLELGL